MTVNYYVLEIPRCHGVDPDAVAVMLSSWVQCLSEYDEFLEEEFLNEILEDYDMTEMEALLLSERVLDAIEAVGLDSLIRHRRDFLTAVHCKVVGQTADLKLTWGNP